MEIRKAKISDLHTIVSFQLLMAKETEGLELDESIVEKGVRAVLEDASKGNYYVSSFNGEVAGSLLTTFEWSDWRNGTILWIQSVYVKSEFRRRGVYKNMYAHLKALVLNNENLKGIRLYADKTNHLAQKTYETLGMSKEHYVTFEWMK